MNPTTPTQNYELLREAAAIIDGIPARRFNLGSIIRTKNGQPVTKATDRGAVGCGLGWLGLHPKFQALGLVTSYDPTRSFWEEERLVYKQQDYYPSNFDKVAADLFGISQSDAHNLFKPNSYAAGSDKAEFRRRVVAFLKANGQTVGDAE